MKKLTKMKKFKSLNLIYRKKFPKISFKLFYKTKTQIGSEEFKTNTGVF